MIGNISSKPAPSISGWWQTMDENCFLAWFQGTSQLLESRGILTQCPLGLRPWEPPHLVSLWCSNRVWALFSCCTDVWSLGWVQVNVFVPVSEFIKTFKKAIKSVSPTHEPFWLSVRLRCWKNRGTGMGCQQSLFLMEANFLPFFWC